MAAEPPNGPRLPAVCTLAASLAELLADVTRDFAGSTVYFVIRKADLAKRDLSRVEKRTSRSGSR